MLEFLDEFKFEHKQDELWYFPGHGDLCPLIVNGGERLFDIETKADSQGYSLEVIRDLPILSASAKMDPDFEDEDRDVLVTYKQFHFPPRVVGLNEVPSGFAAVRGDKIKGVKVYR
jgi:hypothetical protein